MRAIAMVLLAACGGGPDMPTQEQIQSACNQWCVCDAAAPFPEPDCWNSCPDAGGPFAACTADQVESFADCVSAAPLECGRCFYETGCGQE